MQAASQSNAPKTLTKLALTERDRYSLFGFLLERHRGLIGSRFGAEATSARAYAERDLAPLKGVGVTVANKEFWGLCTTDTSDVIRATNWLEHDLLLLPVVPAALGRWAHAPPPPLMDSIAARVCSHVEGASVRYVALYLMGSAVIHPTGATVGWTPDGRVGLKYDDQLSGELSRTRAEEMYGAAYPLSVIEETGVNMFVMCIGAIVENWFDGADRRAVMRSIQRTLDMIPPSGCIESRVGDATMTMTYRRSHLGPRITVERGALPKETIDIVVAEAWWNSVHPKLTWPRFDRIALDETCSLPNMVPSNAGISVIRSVYEAWRGAWFNVEEHVSTPDPGSPERSDWPKADTTDGPNRYALGAGYEKPSLRRGNLKRNASNGATNDGREGVFDVVPKKRTTSPWQLHGMSSSPQGVVFLDIDE